MAPPQGPLIHEYCPNLELGHQPSTSLLVVAGGMLLFFAGLMRTAKHCGFEQGQGGVDAAKDEVAFSALQQLRLAF